VFQFLVCGTIKKVIAPGAQTERRGDAGPVRSVLRGKPHRPLFSSRRHRTQLVSG
jgi:hypothetical protein